MPLTPEEKERRKAKRMLEKFAEYTLGTCKNKVATDFQRMIRAEAAAEPPGFVEAVVDGEIDVVWRGVGECVCVTCGTVAWWKGAEIGGGTIETGHFIASRAASIIFEPTNANPQCKRCNRHLSGNQANYELWMQHIYGPDEPDRLRQLRHQPKQFTREELVELRILYMARAKAAELVIDTY